MGLGRDVTFGDDPDGFLLIQLVGRIWISATRYAAAVEKFDLKGPFRAVLGLRGTDNTALGGLANGWAEPWSGMYDFDEIPRCAEPNILLSLELGRWPTGEAIGHLAFMLGDWIEDSWGMEKRRYVARIGELEGEFDYTKYNPR